MQFRVEFYHDEEGYSVSVPDLPGCHTQGDTLEEAKENVKDAIRLYLETVQEVHGMEGLNRILEGMGSKTFLDMDVTLPIAAHA